MDWARRSAQCQGQVWMLLGLAPWHKAEDNQSKHELLVSANDICSLTHNARANVTSGDPQVQAEL